MTGGFIPPSPPRDLTLDNPNDARARDLALWNYLQNQATIPVNIPSGAASGILLSRPCILAGFSLRETTGTADLQVEFLDSTGAGGPVVAEQTILAPLPGSVGQVITDLDASSTAAASANNVTLAALAGATTYITGFEITGDGATGASIITITVTGVLGGTKTYFLTIPAGVSTAITPLIVEYARPIPASGLNVAIVVNVPSFGSGNTNAAVTAHGYQLTTGSTAGQSGQTATSDLGEPGVLCRGGLYLRVITGSVVGSAWVRV